jgi:hypothetical protein
MHFFRMASGLSSVLAATSLQDSELPYLIIIAFTHAGWGIRENAFRVDRCIHGGNGGME